MSKIKVLICDGMAADSVKTLESNSLFEIDLRKQTDAQELLKIIPNYHVVVVRSATTITKEVIEKGQNLKLIVRAGAGVDNINVPEATLKKIPVMNTASANSLAAAEHTIALMFSMLREIPVGAQMLKESKWDRAQFKGYEATGKVLGVLGLGNIGRIVAEKGIGLGMKVIGYDPSVSSSKVLSEKLQKETLNFELVNSVEKVLSSADILTLHLPKTKDTANIINAQSLTLMKKGAFLVNCARGGLVDESAVLQALESGQLTRAAFDVYEKEPPVFPNPLFNHPLVFCTPHLGASTVEAQQRVGATAVEQMIAYFQNGIKKGIINEV